MLGFPLLLIPFAVYNVIAFLMPFDWGTKLYSFRLPSGLTFEPTAGDAFLAFSLLMLMFEFIKSTKHGKSLVEHFLCILLVGAAGAEFAMVSPTEVMKQAAAPVQMGNSVFALFVVICAVDLLAGFAASLRRARRKVVVEQQAPVVVAPVPPAAVAPVVRAEPPRVVEPARVEPTRVEPVAVEPVAPPAGEPRQNPFIKVEPAEKIP